MGYIFSKGQKKTQKVGTYSQNYEFAGVSYCLASKSQVDQVLKHPCKFLIFAVNIILKKGGHIQPPLPNQN